MMTKIRGFFQKKASEMLFHSSFCFDTSIYKKIHIFWEEEKCGISKASGNDNGLKGGDAYVKVKRV